MLFRSWAILPCALTNLRMYSAFPPEHCKSSSGKQPLCPYPPILNNCASLWLTTCSGKKCRYRKWRRNAALPPIIPSLKPLNGFMALPPARLINDRVTCFHSARPPSRFSVGEIRVILCDFQGFFGGFLCDMHLVSDVFQIFVIIVLSRRY